MRANIINYDRAGAIVAIKDLHEHMYFAVEAVDDKYRVGGVLHYSLARERALFRVSISCINFVHFILQMSFIS